MSRHPIRVPHERARIIHRATDTVDVDRAERALLAGIVAGFFSTLALILLALIISVAVGMPGTGVYLDRLAGAAIGSVGAMIVVWVVATSLLRRR